MRLTILGGGGFRVPLVYRALCADADLGVDELVLYDVDASRLDVVSDGAGARWPPESEHAPRVPGPRTW